MFGHECVCMCGNLLCVQMKKTDRVRNERVIMRCTNRSTILASRVSGSGAECEMTSDDRLGAILCMRMLLACENWLLVRPY